MKPEKCIKCFKKFKHKQLKFRIYPVNDKLHKYKFACIEHYEEAKNNR